MLSGTNAFLLTEEQRSSRALNITVEKVRTPGDVEYFNFRQPEPAAFWGYIQLMQRDFVVESRQLNYRRESVLRSTEQLPDQIDQVSCLVKASTEFLFSQIADLLISTTDATSESLNQVLEVYRSNQVRPKLTPVQPITALWYEIVPLFSAYITVTWSAYPDTCDTASPILLSPNAPAPTKKPGNEGGGGGRPAPAPPPGRTSDLNSDSPSPPPGGATAPDSPTDAPTDASATRITFGGGSFVLDNCSQESIPPQSVTVAGYVPVAAISIGRNGPGASYAGFCNISPLNDWTVFLLVDGIAASRSFGPAKFTSFPEVISVEYIGTPPTAS